MQQIREKVREKLDRLAKKILEFLSGSTEYIALEMKAKVPDVRKVAKTRMTGRFPPAGGFRCDRY